MENLFVEDDTSTLDPETGEETDPVKLLAKEKEMVKLRALLPDLFYAYMGEKNPEKKMILWKQHQEML